MGFEIKIGGIFTLLTIIFVIAKIMGYISWSWWLVFLPAIIGTGLAILIILIVIILAIIKTKKDKYVGRDL